MRKPLEVKELLDNVLSRLKPPRGKVLERLQVAWKEVAGKREAERSRVKQFKLGIIYVEVDSAPMMHHIRGKDKEVLLTEIRQRLEGVYIKDIKVRMSKE